MKSRREEKRALREAAKIAASKERKKQYVETNEDLRDRRWRPKTSDPEFALDEVDKFSAVKERRGPADADHASDEENVVGFRDLGVDDDDGDDDVEMGGESEDDSEGDEGSDGEEEDSDDEFLQSQLARIKKQLRKEELASDIEDDDDEEEDEDKPADAWGRRMADFRGTDVVDPRDEEQAKMEEEEAAALRARIAKDFDDADFDIAQFLPEDTVPGPAEEGKRTDKKGAKPVVERNLAKLTKAQKIDLVKQESPELLPLLPEFKEKLEELRTKLNPAMERLEVVNVPDLLSDFVRLKFDLVCCYCVNLSFYMALKSNRTPVANHPIVKRLLTLRKLIKELDPAADKLDFLVEKLANGEEVPPLEASATNRSKESVRFKDESSSSESEPEPEPENEEDKAGDDGAGKRAITYQIAKNKGLVAKKKKELRNPRVKNRLKYRKAKIRRRGQVREVRKEIQRYAGEISGVRAGVVKSIKFK